MKDYDDLFRIKKSKIAIDRSILKRLFESKGLDFDLKKSWISEEMNKRWQKHIKNYHDLPSNLEEVFEEINDWLLSLKKSKTRE